MNKATISAHQYQQLQQFLEDSCGIVLGENRQYLVASRLNGLVGGERFACFADLLDSLQRGDRTLKAEVIDLMTTNETSWFRNETPFEVFAKEVLADLHGRSVAAPRIWSAACSFGQEPYSLSILVDEFERQRKQSLGGLRIIATDISATVLNQARQACYDDAALLRGVSGQRRQAYFERCGDGWRVKDGVRRRIQFREFNLLEEFAALGRFDVIFCRNVLIYFSAAVKDSILARMAAVMNPVGYLFLGGTETIGLASRYFETLRFDRNLVYRKRY